jgi:hypothetical protein
VATLRAAGQPIPVTRTWAIPAAATRQLFTEAPGGAAGVVAVAVAGPSVDVPDPEFPEEPQPAANAANAMRATTIDRAVRATLIGRP